MSRDEDDAPPKVLSRLFWVAMAIAALSLASAAAIGLYGTRLFPPARADAAALAHAPTRDKESPPDPSGPP